MFNTTIGVLRGLAKDTTAWVGGIVSTIANVSIDAPRIELPHTLEGWGAVGVSAATILYIACKTVVLLRNNRKK